MTNVCGVLKRMLAKESAADLRDFQSNKIDSWDAIGMRALGSITPEKLAKASAPALIMVAGTAEDKVARLKGLPNNIDVHYLVDIASMLRNDPPRTS